jgi:hypothetical protein
LALGDAWRVTAVDYADKERKVSTSHLCMAMSEGANQRFKPPIAHHPNKIMGLVHFDRPK